MLSVGFFYLLGDYKTVISSYAYTLDAAGNRTKVVEHSGRTVEYTYDDTYKLQEEKITNPDSSVSVISYTYDKVGNRKTKTENGVTTTYQYNENNQLVIEDDITYSYDDNGNLKEKNSAGENITYYYDPENHLTRVETTRFGVTITVEYEYDAEGNRVRKVLDGMIVTTYLVDANRDYAQVLEERDGNGDLVVRYVYGLDLISQTRGGATSYYHYDGLGSTRALTNSAEAVTDTYTYDAFGLLLEQTGSTGNNYLFTGEQFDPELGFYYLRARYMDPNVGRFVTMDSFEGINRDPITLHKYLYANANPIISSDPSGYIALMTETTKTSIRNMFERMRIPITKQALAVLRNAKALARVLRFPYKGVQIDPIRIILKYLFWKIALNKGRELLDWLVNEKNYKITEFEDDDKYGIYLYKEGGNTKKTFTPRPDKDDLEKDWPAAGLSFVTDPEHIGPKGEVYITPGNSFQIINANKLKTLELKPDPEDPKHVLVRPGSLSELKAWAATRDTGEMHPYTKEVWGARVGRGKKPK